ncbi:MAG: hypothetical protein II244_07715 [Clostridia bacterium]|nr:hypothetical protein [Clostridia bacterium]
MRKLKVDEIECRVATVSEKGCSLLLYKTARVDRAILDEMYTPCGWQNDFKVIDGKMYGGIGVRINNDNGSSEWVWKWDCGTESNTEAEKGQASDCFKRAGFKWGIGVELYTAPFIFINCTTVKDEYNSKPNKPVYKLKDKYIKYEVVDIGYSDKGEINKLKIKDSNGNIVYEMGKYIAPQRKQPEKKPKQTVSDRDMEFFNVISNIDDINDLREYYKTTKEQVEDKKAYYDLVISRSKALKGE